MKPIPGSITLQGLKQARKPHTATDDLKAADLALRIEAALQVSTEVLSPPVAAGWWAVLRRGFDAATNAQIASATRLFDSYVRPLDHTKVPWITENPGRQGALLTGSIEPIETTDAEWYGSLWRAA